MWRTFMSKPVVLAIDDTVSALKYYNEALSEQYSVSCAKSGAIALRYLENHIPDIILLDWHMPEMSGKDTIAEIKKIYPEVPVIIISGDPNIVVDRKKIGAADIADKSIKPEQLCFLISRYLNRGI